MAFVGRSMCLFQGEIIGNTFIRLGLPIDECFSSKGAVQFCRVVNFQSNSTNSRHFPITFAGKVCEFGSKHSALLSRKTEESSSSFSTRRSEPEVILFINEHMEVVANFGNDVYLPPFCFIFQVKQVIEFVGKEVSNIFERWKQSHFMVLVGLLACTFVVIPSAGAVDALKTCACLLKECR